MILAAPEAEAGGSKVQGLPEPQGKFKACLGNSVRLCLKIKRTNRAGYIFAAYRKTLKTQRFSFQPLRP